MSFAYDELYVPLAQRVLGDMYDFAVNTLRYTATQMADLFIGSGMAKQFERGNPSYIAGKNGCEIAKEVIMRCGYERPLAEDVMFLDKTPEYWIGWSLAYYQWSAGIPFVEIHRCVPMEELYGMYPVYHEMDIEHFVEQMDVRCKKTQEQCMLRRLRAYANMTQKELADTADVPLRQIQLFEQGQRDIRKTQGETLEKLASVLQCNMETLVGK